MHTYMIKHVSKLLQKGEDSFLKFLHCDLAKGAAVGAVT